MALRLLAQLPKRALLLGDRLYGVAAFAVHAQAACERVGSHFLLRAPSHVKPRVLTRLGDGSRLIRLAVRQHGRPTHILRWLTVREIRVRIGRPGHRAHQLRAWTSLMDPQTAPALELARLYASRWEHELYFREIKRQLRKTNPLQSHTLETAAQELAALVLASALIATERMRAAAGQVPVLRVSFAKVLELVRPLWLLLDAFDDVVTNRDKNRVVQRIYTQMGRCVTAPRRSRTCPRAIRQPTKPWPRLLHPQSVEGPFQFDVL